MAKPGNINQPGETAMVRKSLTALALTAGLLAAPSAFACQTGCGLGNSHDTTVNAPNLSHTVDINNSKTFAAQNGTVAGSTQVNLGTHETATKGGSVITEVGGSVVNTQE
jgi:hypothetical protein